MTCEVVKPLLSAYMDGEIDSVRRSVIESHLAGCPSCMTELDTLERLRDTIRARGRLYEAPSHLRDQLRFTLRSSEYLEPAQRRTNWTLWGSVAAGLLLVTLGSAPFLVNARNHRQLIAEELLSAHERALLGRGVDVVSSDRHTVKPWFNGKLPFSPPVVDLAQDGFPLEGGRLDYAGGHPVAVLVYRRRLHSIDVFVWPSANEDAPPRHFDRNGYHELSWTKSGFVFTAISDLNTAELETFANLMQTR
jgi:anti-sigma factor (TIGR02949 family)